MGNGFIDGYCSLASGEKDPRNLKLVLGMDRVILVEFDISEKVEVRGSSRTFSTGCGSEM
jgi:DNA repair/transcription protein MET18/MMS19